MITEKHLPLLLVAAEHHYVSKVSDALIEQFTTDFEHHLAQAGATLAVPGHFFTVFQVPAYRDHDYHMELWAEVTETLADTAHLRFQFVPACECACLTTGARYNDLQSAYDALYDYVRQQGAAPAGAPRETYLASDTAPGGFETEILLPFTRCPIPMCLPGNF